MTPIAKIRIIALLAILSWVAVICAGRGLWQIFEWIRMVTT